MTQFEDVIEKTETKGKGKSHGAATTAGAGGDRKKKRREGNTCCDYILFSLAGKKAKHGTSTVISCLKRLLPVGLNIFGGRELDIVQQTKEKFLKVGVVRESRFVMQIPVY